LSRTRGIPLEDSLPAFPLASGRRRRLDLVGCFIDLRRLLRATPARSVAAAPMADGKHSVSETFSRLREQGKVRLTFVSFFYLCDLHYAVIPDCALCERMLFVLAWGWGEVRSLE
jgi:hypothetical protein